MMNNIKNENIATGMWIKQTRESKTVPNPRTGKLLKMTQTNLANHLGVTFQQVQKYEQGLNSLSLPRFRFVCNYFETKPNSAFEQIDMQIKVLEQNERPLVENLKAKNNETEN